MSRKLKSPALALVVAVPFTIAAIAQSPPSSAPASGNTPSNPSTSTVPPVGTSAPPASNSAPPATTAAPPAGVSAPSSTAPSSTMPNGSRPSTSPAAPTSPTRVGGGFNSLDTNGDGRISRAEAAGDQGLTGSFSRLDRNGDGYIDAAEYGRMGSSNTNNNPGPGG